MSQIYQRYCEPHQASRKPSYHTNYQLIIPQNKTVLCKLSYAAVFLYTLLNSQHLYSSNVLPIKEGWPRTSSLHFRLCSYLTQCFHIPVKNAWVTSVEGLCNEVPMSVSHNIQTLLLQLLELAHSKSLSKLSTAKRKHGFLVTIFIYTERDIISS